MDQVPHGYFEGNKSYHDCQTQTAEGRSRRGDGCLQLMSVDDEDNIVSDQLGSILLWECLNNKL